MILPDDSQRHLISGSTGSGKTHFGAYTLSQRSYITMPWIMINFKDDDLLDSIPATELTDAKLPDKMSPGIYVIRPDIDDWDTVEALFLNAWKRQNTGIFVDEALEISKPVHPKFRKVLTQGRSRHVPVIMNCQRPIGLDRYAFSESQFLSFFAQEDSRDLDIIEDMTGRRLDMNVLPKFHSYYIDRPNKRFSIIPPVPDADSIIDIFHTRLRKIPRSRMI